MQPSDKCVMFAPDKKLQSTSFIKPADILRTLRLSNRRNVSFVGISVFHWMWRKTPENTFRVWFGGLGQSKLDLVKVGRKIWDVQFNQVSILLWLDTAKERDGHLVEVVHWEQSSKHLRSVSSRWTLFMNMEDTREQGVSLLRAARDQGVEIRTGVAQSR